MQSKPIASSKTRKPIHIHSKQHGRPMSADMRAMLLGLKKERGWSYTDLSQRFSIDGYRFSRGWLCMMLKAQIPLTARKAAQLAQVMKKLFGEAE